VGRAGRSESPRARWSDTRACCAEDWLILSLTLGRSWQWAEHFAPSELVTAADRAGSVAAPGWSNPLQAQIEELSKSRFLSRQRKSQLEKMQLQG
jgi:hypothetical protein